ncbi:MAG: ATP-dependent DNA ligase [Actinomycetota bacterium]|nr:ATP-dependent DNA ligase [Actinomycetota bacterium]
MSFLIPPPIEPMLARLQEQIPRGEGWLYEPKWDGFRAIVFRDGDNVHIGSRNTLPLARYFPDVVDVACRALPDRCVVDGEIIIAGDSGLEFETLQLRLHPAASRVKMLAEQTPASFVAFDCLAAGSEDMRKRPFSERRRQLVESIEFSTRCFATPQTENPDEATGWFDRFEGAGLDGVVAKRADGPYVPGERVMVKVKHARTADCVVGGYRKSKDGKGIGSLLLGLFDGGGVLHHVGHTSSFSAKEKRELAELLAPLEGEGSFVGGRMPGGPSRWSQGKDMAWVSLDPKLVCEVAFDHLQGDRFRHATRFLRWRPDKRPSDCTFEQLDAPRPFDLQEIVRMGRR